MMPFGSVTYDYYANVFLGGAIQPDDFPHFQTRAAAYVDGMCRGLCENVREQDWDQMKFAVCAVAEIVQDEERMRKRSFNHEKVVASETVGNYSVSYGTGTVSHSEAAFLEKKKQEALTLYLSAVPALKSLFHVRSFPCLHHIR